MASLQLEVVTPDRMVVSREVDYVGVPGIEGEFGVLPGHIPFLSALSVGCMHYVAGGQTKYVFIAGGFSEVSDNKVSVLAEAAEESSEIDVDRAQKARDRALKRLAEIHAEQVDVVRAEAALRRATTRLSIIGR